MKTETGGWEDGASLSALLMPMPDGPLLVPLTAVAEVLTGTVPARVVADPAWLHGWIPWRHASVPVLSLPAVAGGVREAVHAGSVIAVFNAVAAAASRGFFAIALAGFPHSVRLSAASGLALAPGQRCRAGELLAVVLGAEQLRIPDFDHLEQLAVSVPPPGAVG